MDGPVQLIQVEPSGKCSIIPETLRIVQSIKTPIAIVSVAGLYRTGKSFLLNRLLGLQDGFEIGATVNACTKGLWIWSSPLQINPNLNIIFLDTEGLGSIERDQTTDMHIFTLAILLSSSFVYNSMGSIDENALENLSLVCNITKHIHIKSRPVGSNEDPDAYAQYFPSFTWVLRDFSLQLVDNQGNEINAREYLENCLKLVEEQDEDTRNKNKIRKTISEFFQNRDCFTLVRPINDEKKLRNINEVPYNELRQNFRMQVEQLVTKLINTVRPKAIDNNVLNGSMLAALLGQYVEAINNDAVPTITTAWQRVVEQELKRAFQAGVQNYRNALQKRIVDIMPVEEDFARQVDREARRSAFSEINNLKLVDVDWNKVREGLNQQLDEIFDNLLNQNWNESKEFNEKKLESQHQAQESFEDTLQQWDKLLQEFSKTSKGPARHYVLCHFMQRKLMEDTDKAYKKAQFQFAQQKTELERQIAEITGRMQGARDMLNEERKNFQQVLEMERQRFQESRMQLEAMLDDTRRQLDKKVDEFTQYKENLEHENNLLKKEQGLGFALPGKGKKLATSTELIALQQVIEETLGRLNKSEHERSLIDIKFQNDRHIMSLERKFQKQLSEAKKASDLTIENLKRSYVTEISQLKNEKLTLEQSIQKFQIQNQEQNGVILALQERIKSEENEKKLKVDHAELLCKVSDLILKFSKKMDGWSGDVSKEMQYAQESVDRMREPKGYYKR